jgi:YidC/Oxa1 family membrane protein insertase
MLSTIWSTVFFNPFLNLMIVFYHFLGNNLGLAIFGVAFLVRLFLIPLMKKQREMTQTMGSIKPEVDKLQKKYANNKEKLASEQIKLYKKAGYNPLGCVGTFIPQIVILSVLIGVIRAVTNSNLEGLYPFVRDLTKLSNGIAIDTKFFFWDLTKSYSEVSAEYGRVAIQSLPYIGLSILVGITQYWTTHFTQKMQNLTPAKKKSTKKKDSSSMEDMQASMQKSTMFLLPLMTVFFTISMPAALGWYWFVQSLLLVLQYFSLDFDKTKRGVQNLWDIFERKNKLNK